MTTRVIRSVGLASRHVSKLPKGASRVHHAVNNLASAPGTRLLYFGDYVTSALWGNEDAKCHWVDESHEDPLPRPDVHPYDLVVATSGKLRPYIVKKHIDTLADEVVYAVVGWNSSDVRRGTDRELGRLSHRYSCIARFELLDWDEGLGVFVLAK